MEHFSLFDNEFFNKTISKSFDIIQGEIKYKLNIEYDDNNITFQTFQISEEEIINELYETKLNIEDIRKINPIFSDFTYCQQLYDYIINQKENNYLELVILSKNKMSIKLKQKNIEINLFKKKQSVDIIIKNLCEETSKLKKIIKTLELSLQKYKNLDEKIENIINEKIKNINEEIKKIQKNQKIENIKEKLDKNIKLKKISNICNNITRFNKLNALKKQNIHNGRDNQIKKNEFKKKLSRSSQKKPLNKFHIKANINQKNFLESINENENEYYIKKTPSFNNTPKKRINIYNYSTPEKKIKNDSFENKYNNLNLKFRASNQSHSKKTRNIEIDEIGNINNFYSKQNSSNSQSEKKNSQLNTICTSKDNRINIKNYKNKNNKQNIILKNKIKNEKILHNIKYSIINKKSKDDVFGNSNKNNNFNDSSLKFFNGKQKIQSKSSSNIIKEIIFNKNDNEPKNNSDINNLNAFLQCLLNIKKFTNYFLTKKDEILLKYDKNSLLIIFTEIIDDFNRKKFIKKNCLNNLNNLICENLKNDLGKLVEFMITNLHNELSKNNSLNPDFNHCFDQDFNLYFENYEKHFKSSFKSIISELFYFLYNTQIKCRKCKKNTNNIRFSYLLKFPLKKVKEFKEKSEDLTIKECFKYHQNYRYFENTCNNCKSKGNYLEKKILIKGPKVLLINLTEGINIKFKLEEKINLSNYISDKENKYIYKLIGIVTDKDKEIFISFFKNLKDDRWNKYDGGAICLSSFERVSHSGNPASMLLFYLLDEN